MNLKKYTMLKKEKTFTKIKALDPETEAVEEIELLMDKKGFLLGEETLKIVIAIIAIGFLAYFLASLYFSAQASREMKQAEESLDFIISEALAGRASVDIYNPKNWWILNNEATGELCICEDDLNSCDKKGVCMNNSGFLVQSPIKIENPPITLSINQESKTIGK